MLKIKLICLRADVCDITNLRPIMAQYASLFMDIKQVSMRKSETSSTAKVLESESRSSGSPPLLIRLTVLFLDAHQSLELPSTICLGILS